MFVIFSLIALIALAIKLISSPKNYRNPSYFTNYSNSGYYKINPETILDSIDRGETDVFMPLLEDPDQIEDLHNSITWTQEEYLKIADTLSQFVWNEPLDLENWNVFFIYFSVGCESDLRGFNDFTIVYYKNLDTINWERIYTTRLIEIQPWDGVLRWGGGDEFSSSLLLGWDKINLTNFKITVDEALQKAEENGGLETRIDVDDNCRIIASMNKHLMQHVWEVEYYSADFKMRINPTTGKFSTSQ